MAQEIFNNVLTSKIKSKEILEWLTTDDFNDNHSVNLNISCTKEEFIIFFLNYLRDQFTSVLQTINCKETPKKNITSQQLKQNRNTILEDSESPKDNQNDSACSINNLNLEKEKGDSKLSIQNFASIESCTETTKKLSLNSNSTPEKHNIADIDKSVGIQNILNLTSSSASPQTSTPVSKKKTPNRRRVELIRCSSQGQNVNTAFKENFECEQFNSSFDNRNITFDNNSFPKLGGNNSSHLNLSNVSANNDSDSSDMLQTNVSQKSNFSLQNKILQSPVSPLYSSSMSKASPISIRMHQNKRSDSSSNVCHFQQNHTSTPEKNSHNEHKNLKTSRDGPKLSDFICHVIEGQNTKKSRGKKNSNKMLLRNGEQNSTDQENILLDTSAQLEQNTRMKKVNPTRINITDEKDNKENTVFGVVSRPFMQNPHFVNVSPIDKSVDDASFEVERGLVKKERQKNPGNIVNTNTITAIIDNQPKKLLLRTPQKSKNNKSIVIPNKELVENKEILDILAKIYSGFLDHNLIVNPMTELYFIIQLITIQYTENTKEIITIEEQITNQSNDQITEIINDSSNIQKNLSSFKKALNFDNIEESDTDQNNEDCKNKKINIIKDYKNVYFSTPHNCVYFSTQVLNYQKVFLKCLDRVTLKLLCENIQIASFQPELCKYLDTIYSIKVNETNKMKQLLSIGSLDLNVCFQVDNDNREKFPSSQAFSSFRQQRDMFYEILKIWEDNHLIPGWKFEVALSGKIKNMLSIHVDITNLTHFTELFKSQMLISCVQSSQQEDFLDDETLSCLKNLKDVNPTKLTQLQKKLVTPFSQNGPVPLPSFPGIQEFYKDFILHSSNSMFYLYLENTFIKDIMELNNSHFVGSDIEETDTEVDDQTKQNFVICLSSLRLLSKFLGLITSLPYKSVTSMLKDVISSQIILRSECLPRINLQYCLQTAVIQGKLSLTVPWIVEYLAMMDHASLRLPYYKKVLEMLYCIYRACNYQSNIKSEELMSYKTAVLVKLVIGWLFELPIFPTELYYSWQSKYNDKALKTICDTQQLSTNFENSLVAETSIISVRHSLFLDKLEIVDDRILYSCCPFLRELNILLTPGNSSLNSSTSYRHVTPVTSQLQNHPKNIKTKHLEIQLEEAFFHGQPMSTRKTVEYVSERVASSCVKHICNNLLPVERQTNNETLKKITEECYSDILEKNPEHLKRLLLKDMNLLSEKSLKSLKEKIEQIMPKFCEPRIIQSIDSLLAEDCLKSVKDICAKIALRMAFERINQWSQSHMVGSCTFIKYMEIALSGGFKCNDVPVTDKKYYNPKIKTPTDVLDNMRKLIWDLIETSGESQTEESISQIWYDLNQILTQESDSKTTPKQTIASLSVDLCLFLITYRENLFTLELQEKIIKVWKIDHLKFNERDSPLSRILCPRNVMLMAHPAKDNVWLIYGKFLRKLLKENILSIDTLNDQAIALLRNEWPIPITKNLSTCLKEAIDNYKSTDDETERINYLLGWIAEAYNDMDLDSFSFD